MSTQWKQEFTILLWQRIADAARFYLEEAKRSKSPSVGAYLLYLHVRKSKQLELFEKLSRDFLPEHRIPSANARRPRPKLAKYQTCVHSMNLAGVRDFAAAASENDQVSFEAFSSLAKDRTQASLVEDTHILERDFSLDVQAGFLDFLSRELVNAPIDFTTVNHVSS